ncbi:MAG: pilus assembly protein [Galactobacter sp.]
MRAAASRGSVVVEFLGLGLLLAVPLVYLLVTMSQVERASLAVVTLAEESSRAHATAASPWSAHEWQQRAEREIARDYGVDTNAIDVTITCSGSCPGPGSRVTAQASVKVALPLVPVTAARVGTVTSTSVTLAPRYG